jgi:hypothetical protein
MAILAPPDHSQTAVLMRVLSSLSIVVMALRLVMGKVRRCNFDVGDYVKMGAIFCWIVQIGLVYAILIWGTNILTEAYRTSHHFAGQEKFNTGVDLKLQILLCFYLFPKGFRTKNYSPTYSTTTLLIIYLV